MNGPTKRRIIVEESAAIPALDVPFAFGPMVPFVAGAAISWIGGSFSPIALQATALWGVTILIFLSGVRRGLSFRTDGGPTGPQIATMLALYSLALAALVAVWLGVVVVAFALLLVGYSIVLIFDPIAASRGEVPLHFGPLRRLQMPIALLSLFICLAVTIEIR